MIYYSGHSGIIDILTKNGAELETQTETEHETQPETQEEVQKSIWLWFWTDKWIKMKNSKFVQLISIDGFITLFFPSETTLITKKS